MRNYCERIHIIKYGQHWRLQHFKRKQFALKASPKECFVHKGGACQCCSGFLGFVDETRMFPLFFPVLRKIEEVLQPLARSVCISLTEAQEKGKAPLIVG